MLSSPRRMLRTPPQFPRDPAGRRGSTACLNPEFVSRGGGRHRRDRTRGGQRAVNVFVAARTDVIVDANGCFVP